MITAVAAWVPEAMPLSRWSTIESALRATGHRGWNAWMRSWEAGYAHWLQCWPAAQTAGSPVVHSDLLPRELDIMVPVETGTDLSGLAATMANTICAARAAGARPVDVVMFCHGSLDEHVSTTTAGRLCAELGTPCFAFSVSQQHGASVFTALRLALDLLFAEPDLQTVLIIAAEKWYPPFSRLAGAGIVLGDAAGALLVERASHASVGLRLLDAETRRVITCPGRAASGAQDSWAVTLAATIESLLARHRPGQNGQDRIGEIIGHPGMPSLAEAVCTLAGRPHAGLQHEHCIHLGAAESIVRLAQRLGSALHGRGHRLLLWGFGTCGFVGAALLETHDAPFVSLRDMSVLPHEP
ncbi:beta-ketoacyl-[acyl-carrier-protein] synthase family protein [Paraburkholderia graminis]|uniref:3-oxoacyl-ACP synthase n=1 Tax=Paraburkholderia graminis TaxID=60548 RepID=UPI0038B960F8